MGGDKEAWKGKKRRHKKWMEEREGEYVGEEKRDMEKRNEDEEWV